MITLDKKAFFWKKFDENQKPINPKECQIVFNPSEGGTISYLVLTEDILKKEEIDKNIDVLYGHTSQGKPFSLLNLTFNNTSSIYSLNIKMHEIKYSIEYIFYGGWVEPHNLFQHVLVRYSHLEGWFDLIEIDKSFSTEKNIFVVEHIVIYNSNIEGSVKKDKIGFWIKNSWNSGIVAEEGEVCSKLENHLIIAQHQKFTLKEFIEITKKIKSFFEIVSFYSHNNIFIEEFIIQEEQKDLPLDIPNDVQILFKQEGYQVEKKNYINYLFKYKDIEDNFIEILNQWIDNYDKNISEFTAFLNVITDKSTKVNIYSHLFQLMSALEAYHRRNYLLNEKKQLEYNDYLNNLFENLQTSLSEDDTKRIIQSLQYANQPTFRTRLKEMIEISDIKSFLPLSNKIYKSLNNYIYNLRNTIAHSKDIVLVDKKVENSLEFLKLVVLLVMVKDISLNKLDMSNCHSKMNIDSLNRKLRESFG